MNELPKDCLQSIFRQVLDPSIIIQQSPSGATEFVTVQDLQNYFYSLRLVSQTWKTALDELVEQMHTLVHHIESSLNTRYL